MLRNRKISFIFAMYRGRQRSALRDKKKKEALCLSCNWKPRKFSENAEVGDKVIVGVTRTKFS